MKRLILMGPSGCGKSTMIQTALGQDITRAGGCLTVRKLDGTQVLGFDLTSPATPQIGYRFLDFENGGVRNDWIFSDFGIGYLQTPATFAVCDEFGGIELLVDDFYNQLLIFLKSDIPCIGVLKTEASAAAMANKVPLGKLYSQRYQSLLQMLKNDSETTLLSTTGWQDTAAVSTIAQWVNQHVRR